MDDRQNKMDTLADVHARLCLLKSGIICFEDWRKDMLAWAHEQEKKEESTRTQDKASA